MNELTAIPLHPIQITHLSHLRLKLGREFFSRFAPPKPRSSQLACLPAYPSGLSRGGRLQNPILRAEGNTRRLLGFSLSPGCDLNSPKLDSRALRWVEFDARIRFDVGGVRFRVGIAAMTVPTASETVVIRGHSQDCSAASASGASAQEDPDFIQIEDSSSHPCKSSSPGLNGVTEQPPVSNGQVVKHHADSRDSDAVGLRHPAVKTANLRNSESGDEVGHGSTLISTEEAAGLQSGAAGVRSLKGRGEQAQESSKRMRTEGGILRSSVDGGNDDGGRIAKAWEHWRRLGEPKFLVAPMVDQSELPFRMLCRKYGATAAYTPMLHSRLFAQDGKYRATEFSTCAADRPLFVQFCANNPDTLLEAARLIESQCDYVDINLGCPQRIAKKGNYGAFLMDNQPLIKSLVSKLSSNLTTPVSCKIRVYPDLEKTLEYARMIEEAGCSLLAVHGRTRDQKNGREIRADWDAIKAVKAALRIPVLANGNIRWLDDVHDCIAYTGVDGVLSAESLLENPALFGGYRTAPSMINGEVNGALVENGSHSTVDELALLQEYLQLCEQFPVPIRMVRGHVHKLLGRVWFKRNPDIREELNKQHRLTVDWLKDMVSRLAARELVPTAENGKVVRHEEEILLQAA